MKLSKVFSWFFLAVLFVLATNDPGFWMQKKQQGSDVRSNRLEDGACLNVKNIGKPCAGRGLAGLLRSKNSQNRMHGLMREDR